MKKISAKYNGPYYVVGEKSTIVEIFTYKKDVVKYYGVTGTYKQLQEKLSKQGLILTREKE
tara:strand:+ start:550 stop:732 length:183 start_codon:yes stop_codon:yes gene_type:complete